MPNGEAPSPFLALNQANGRRWSSSFLPENISQTTSQFVFLTGFFARCPVHPDGQQEHSSECLSPSRRLSGGCRLTTGWSLALYIPAPPTRIAGPWRSRCCYILLPGVAGASWHGSRPTMQRRRLPDVAAAAAGELAGLGGCRSVGGCRPLPERWRMPVAAVDLVAAMPVSVGKLAPVREGRVSGGGVVAS